MHLQNIAFVHYVIPKEDAHVKQKASYLGYPDVRAYYRDMDKLHICGPMFHMEQKMRTICAHHAPNIPENFCPAFGICFVSVRTLRP